MRLKRILPFYSQKTLIFVCLGRGSSAAFFCCPTLHLAVPTNSVDKRFAKYLCIVHLLPTCPADANGSTPDLLLLTAHWFSVPCCPLLLFPFHNGDASQAPQGPQLGSKRLQPLWTGESSRAAAATAATWATPSRSPLFLHTTPSLHRADSRSLLLHTHTHTGRAPGSRVPQRNRQLEADIRRGSLHPAAAHL